MSQLSDDTSPVGRNVRLMRLRRGETVQTQTPSLPAGRVIICAVLAALPAVPSPCSPADSLTLHCGCADHHGGLTEFG